MKIYTNWDLPRIVLVKYFERFLGLEFLFTC